MESDLKQQGFEAIKQKYEVLEIIGEGAFGQIAKAKKRMTGKIYAIKRISSVFSSLYKAKQVMREISILHQLSLQKDNPFTVRLFDVLLPCKDWMSLEVF